MRWDDDQRTDRRYNGVQARRAKADAEHDAQEEEQKCTAYTDDDRGQIAVVGETWTLGGIADDACDDDGAEECEDLEWKGDFEEDDFEAIANEVVGAYNFAFCE